MLVHGASGVGKSWLGDTTPAPRLILDAEGRAKYLPSHPKITWNPLIDKPPAVGDWKTCVVTVHNIHVLSSVYQWLRSGRHPFVSVVIDSLMEIQKRVIDEVAGVNQLTTSDWGTVLRRLENLVRSYRDLTMLDDNPVSVVLFTVGSTEYNGLWKPLLQGALRETLPYYLDVVGYMYAQQAEDGVVVRSLLVHPHQNFVAKDGTNRLPGPIIHSPNVGTMIELMHTTEGRKVDVSQSK